MELRTWALVGSVFVASSTSSSAEGEPPFCTVPSGFAIRPYVSGLDFPTAITSQGTTMWVVEGGLVASRAPKVKRIDARAGGASVTTVLAASDLPSGALLAPLTDIEEHDGWLWITHHALGANGWLVGAVSRFRSDDAVGTFTTVLTNLPSAGDHPTAAVTFGPDGRGYVSLGTASNSSVVGPDSDLSTGWLIGASTFHDFPAKDVVLDGREYQTLVPIALDPQRELHTPTYGAFGTGFVAQETLVRAPTPAEPREGMIAGGGAVYSFDPSAADAAATLRLEAWGLRNPYGIGFDPVNPERLLVTNHGVEVRVADIGGLVRLIGPRPVTNDFDDLFEVFVGGDEEFFGWPDYFHHPLTGSVQPVTDLLHTFTAPGIEIRPAKFVLAESFRETLEVERAAAELGARVAAGKFDVSTSSTFEFEGNVFVALTGAYSAAVGVVQYTGHKVMRVDRDTRECVDFVVNTGTTTDELFAPSNFNKPIDVLFVGDTMFVVDLGVFVPSIDRRVLGTGKVWAIQRE